MVLGGAVAGRLRDAYGERYEPDGNAPAVGQERQRRVFSRFGQRLQFAQALPAAAKPEEPAERSSTQ